MPMSRSRTYVILCLGGILSTPATFGAEAPPPSSVAEIQARHDRALIRDLEDYLRKNPKADDLEQAYMALFNKVMEHDCSRSTRSSPSVTCPRTPRGP